MEHEDATQNATHNVRKVLTGCRDSCVIKYKIVEILGIHQMQMHRAFCETLTDAQTKIAHIQDTNPNGTFEIVELVNPIRIRY